jgi:hypothetical protein
MSTERHGEREAGTYTIIDGKEGDIESSSSEIVDDDMGLIGATGRLLLVETVRDGGGRGLVDDAEDVKTSNDTSVLCSLSLRVVEVRGDGDDGVSDLLAKVSLGSLLHLSEHHGRDLFGGLRARSHETRDER